MEQNKGLRIMNCRTFDELLDMGTAKKERPATMSLRRMLKYFA